MKCRQVKKEEENERKGPNSSGKRSRDCNAITRSGEKRKKNIESGGQDVKNKGSFKEKEVVIEGKEKKDKEDTKLN